MTDERKLAIQAAIAQCKVNTIASAVWLLVEAAPELLEEIELLEIELQEAQNGHNTA